MECMYWLSFGGDVILCESRFPAQCVVVVSGGRSGAGSRLFLHYSDILWQSVEMFQVK